MNDVINSFRGNVRPLRKDDRPNPYRRKHIRDTAMHVNLSTLREMRRNTPSVLTNDDQRILFLMVVRNRFAPQFIGKALSPVFEENNTTIHIDIETKNLLRSTMPQLETDNDRLAYLIMVKRRFLRSGYSKGLIK